MNSHRHSITSCVAVVTVLLGTTVSGSAIAQQPGLTLQGLRAQMNPLHTKLKHRVDSLSRNADPPCFDNGNRYVDCGNGTVTDTVTGLIWLKQASCLGTLDYAAANAAAAALQDNQCGLTDHSGAGDWRLPTDAEWQATLFPDPGCRDPSLTNIPGTDCAAAGPAPFPDVPPVRFWSSSSNVDLPSTAWVVDLHQAEFTGMGLNGTNVYAEKTETHQAWPVRGSLTGSAMPSSETLFIRAQITEGLIVASECKTAVAEYVLSQGVVPASNAEVGCTSGPGSYVKQVAVVNGRIDITYGNGAHWAIQDKVLSLTPYEFDSGTGMLTWRCGNTPAPANAQPLAEYLPSTVESKYLPAQCRS